MRGGLARLRRVARARGSEEAGRRADPAQTPRRGEQPERPARLKRPKRPKRPAVAKRATLPASPVSAESPERPTRPARPQRPVSRRRTVRAERVAGPAAPEAPQSPGGTASTDRHAPSVVTTALSKKLKERASLRRRTRWKISGGVAAIVLVLAGIGALTLFSPLFALRADQIQVTGENPPIDKAQVQAIAAEWEGTPLPRLATANVAQKVRADNPWIKRADITRDYPHGLTLALTVRTPVAKTAAGNQLVADDGVLLPGEGVETPPLPVLTVAGGTRAGEHRAAGAHVSAVLNEELRQGVTAIEVAANGRVTLVIGQAKVSWGTIDASDLKARVLHTLLQKPASVYDLTDPLNPTTK